jgi:hypothetical protein
MTIRTSRRTVTFRFPFSIPGLDGDQPAGTYTVETDEELLEQISFPAYHRIATSMMIPRGASSYQIARVDPADLEAAERRDAQAAESRRLTGEAIVGKRQRSSLVRMLPFAPIPPARS